MGLICFWVEWQRGPNLVGDSHSPKPYTMQLLIRFHGLVPEAEQPQAVLQSRQLQGKACCIKSGVLCACAILQMQLRIPKYMRIPCGMLLRTGMSRSGKQVMQHTQTTGLFWT